LTKQADQSILLVFTKDDGVSVPCPAFDGLSQLSLVLNTAVINFLKQFILEGLPRIHQLISSLKIRFVRASLRLTFGCSVSVNLLLFFVVTLAVSTAFSGDVDETRLVEVVQEGQDAGVDVVFGLREHSDHLFYDNLSNRLALAALSFRISLGRGFTLGTSLNLSSFFSILLSDAFTLGSQEFSLLF